MSIIKNVYNSVHARMHRHIDLLPIFPKKQGDKTILKGHISGEHLENPELDDILVENLRQSGIEVDNFNIDTEGYRQYIQTTEYPISYYGGGKDPAQNFIEKSLEHYVSLSFLQLNPHSTFMDIAAATSPFSEIIKEKTPISISYKQDLIYPKGIQGNQVGGDASHIPLANNSIDGATLHCSLEHFEGQSDSLFIQEMERILKPQGRLVVLPFYLAYQYTNHIDPVFNLLRGHKVQLDDDSRMQLRYAPWKQFFSRHYDPQALHDRLLSKAPHLRLKIYQVTNFKEVDKSCYLRFIGVFTKIG